MFTLDSRRGDNEVAINVELPDGSALNVRLDFQSEYTKQSLFRTLDITQRGKWIVGTMPEDDIPSSGQYTVTVSDTTRVLISLDELQTPLNEVDQPLNDLRGLGRSNIIKIIRAVVLGENYPTEDQPTEISRTITQPTALLRPIQVDALPIDIHNPEASPGITRQAPESQNQYYTTDE